MNSEQQEKYDNLVNLFRQSIEENGGVESLIGVQFGTMWPSGKLHSRHEVAEIFEQGGFPRAAKLCREITPERAASQAAQRKGSALCTAMSRKTKRNTGETEHYHLKSLDSEGGHLRSWGVYREVRKAEERASDWELGARVFVADTGDILAAAPVEVPEIAECRAIANALASHMLTLLNYMDNTLFAEALSKAYEEAGCFTHLTTGLMVGMPGKMVEQLTSVLLELRAVTGVQISAEPRFRGGVSETYISESVVREVESQLKELAQTMVADRSRTMKGPLLERRAAELQRLTRLTKEWSQLLSGWDAKLLDQLQQAERAYARASTSLVFDAPEWAVGLATTEEEDPFAIPDAPMVQAPAEQHAPPAADPFDLDESA